MESLDDIEMYGALVIVAIGLLVCFAYAVLYVLTEKRRRKKSLDLKVQSIIDSKKANESATQAKYEKELHDILFTKAKIKFDEAVKAIEEKEKKALAEKLKAEFYETLSSIETSISVKTAQNAMVLTLGNPQFFRVSGTNKEIPYIPLLTSMYDQKRLEEIVKEIEKLAKSVSSNPDSNS